MKAPSPSTVSVYLAVALLVLGLASFAGWQWERARGLQLRLADAQNSNRTLKAQDSALAAQVSELTSRVNQQNQTINQLSQSNSFIDGAPCQTQQLLLSQAGTGGGAAGSYAAYFSYENTSTTSCTLRGYPGFLALDSTGHVMPNGPVNTSNTTPTPIDIAPKGNAYFLAYWPAHDAVGNENGCVSPSLIESTPPGNLTPLVLSVSNLGYICGTPSVGAFTTTAPSAHM